MVPTQMEKVRRDALLGKHLATRDSIETARRVSVLVAIQASIRLMAEARNVSCVLATRTLRRRTVRSASCVLREVMVLAARVW